MKTPPNQRRWSAETLAVHAALEPDPVNGSLAPSVAVSVNHGFTPGAAGFSANESTDMTALPYLYARWTNPTVRQLEQRVAALEGADDGLATASGMAASAVLFFGLLRAGDHLIVSDVCYPGVRELASEILTRFGVQTTAVNLSRPEALQAALRPNTRLVHAETPCNPLLRLSDINAIAAIAHGGGALLSVDSTMATPLATRPLALGADLVMHSLTKALNGHGDALGGILVGEKTLIERLRESVGVRLGAALAARNAVEILRGIDTLVPRMQRMSASALRVAEALEGHPAVTRVIYPGLASHPQHELACRQMDLFSHMITFQTHEPDTMAERLAKTMQLVHYAVSLGHQRSNLVLMRTDELMGSTYHLDGEDLADYRRFAGEGVFRLSVGLEAPDDLISDLSEALGR